MVGKLNWIAVLLLTCVILLTACGPDSPATATPTPAYNLADSAKVDTILRDLLLSYKTGGGIQAVRSYARERGLLDDQDRVRFALTLSSAQAVPTVTERLQQMGAEAYQSHDNQLAVVVNLTKLTGYVSNVDQRNFWEELAALKEVREVRVLIQPSLSFIPNSETLTSSPIEAPTPATSLNEGVKVIGADKWQSVGFKGQGIKVGIIDGGFRGYRSALGNFLPPAGQVIFRSYLLGGGEGNEAHGLAVAEIVHSLAPEASLLLATIEDEIGFAQAVDWLLDNKVQVIQVSLGWAGLFPADGNSKMSLQLERARRQGVLPVVSVGNFAQSHYVAQLNPDAKGYQRFGLGSPLGLKLSAESSNPWASLRWDENWEHPQSNLDLYVLDSNGQVLGSSRNEQGGNSPKPPTELVPFKAEPGKSYYLQVRLNGKSPATPLRFHLFAYNATLEASTAEGSVATPGDARGALSVGAVNWQDDKPEEYSARGPTSDGRPKPEIMGPSRVSIQAFGPDQVFSGTSAAAPQVAGTAALLWSAGPNLTADQIAQYLAHNALKPGNSALLFDPLTGYGRVKLGPVEAAMRGPVELLSALPAGPPFEDNFNKAGSGLPDNTTGYYGKLPEGSNAYFIRLSEPGVISWSAYLDRSFDEFRANFEAAPLEADPAICYGLAFWQQGPQNYYAFLVAGDSYALLRRAGSEWQPVINWGRDAALSLNSNSGKRQQLSLEATSGYIRLRAGETVLQSVALKEARPGGRLGFVAGKFNLTQTTETAFAVFSNLSVTPLTTK